MGEFLKGVLERHLKELEGVELEELLQRRYEKFRRMGTFIDDGGSPRR